MIIIIFIACVLFIGLLGIGLYNVYKVIKFLIETIVNLHDYGR